MHRIQGLAFMITLNAFQLEMKTMKMWGVGVRNVAYKSALDDVTWGHNFSWHLPSVFEQGIHKSQQSRN